MERVNKNYITKETNLLMDPLQFVLEVDDAPHSIHWWLQVPHPDCHLVMYADDTGRSHHHGLALQHLERHGEDEGDGLL